MNCGCELTPCPICERRCVPARRSARARLVIFSSSTEPQGLDCAYAMAVPMRAKKTKKQARNFIVWKKQVTAGSVLVAGGRGRPGRAHVASSRERPRTTILPARHTLRDPLACGPGDTDIGCYTKPSSRPLFRPDSTVARIPLGPTSASCRRKTAAHMTWQEGRRADHDGT